MSYTIRHQDHSVANSSADVGTTPHNITVSEGEVEKLGRGCHNLTVAASNAVASSAASADLELCLHEPVEGLRSSLVSDEGTCPDSADLIVGVSLERGDPVQLLFNLTGAVDTLTDTRDMLNGSFQTYTFSSPLEGKATLSSH